MSDTAVISATSFKRILMVDDAGPVTEALTDLLTRRGHKVEIASDCRSALADYEPGKFDLIITDYVMPGLNGLALARAIKLQDASQPVMLITAFAFTLAAEDLHALPVDAVLRKPFTVAELQSALTDIFSRARQPR
jgi:CheY-like chemotaxis protein